MSRYWSKVSLCWIYVHISTVLSFAVWTNILLQGNAVGIWLVPCINQLNSRLLPLVASNYPTFLAWWAQWVIISDVMPYSEYSKESIINGCQGPPSSGSCSILLLAAPNLGEVANQTYNVFMWWVAECFVFNQIPLTINHYHDHS